MHGAGKTATFKVRNQTLPISSALICLAASIITGQSSDTVEMLEYSLTSSSKSFNVTTPENISGKSLINNRNKIGQRLYNFTSNVYNI